MFAVSQHRSKAAGLSLVEILSTVAVISLLAGVATYAVGNVRQNAQHQKLESDVASLNSAIRIYLASGGRLDGSLDEAGVIRKLKSSRSKVGKETHAGAPSGRMIDPRIALNPVEAASWRARAIYDKAAGRFVSVEDQAGFEFYLDDALGDVAPDLEDRDDALEYASNSGWVWDHASTNNPNAPAGPSTFNTNPNPADSTPSIPIPQPPTPPPSGGGGGGGGTPNPNPTPVIPRLATPNFDKAAGAHPEDDFPLSVSITNVPPAADGTPMIQLNSGSWTPYGGPVSVPMNTTLRAQFVTVDPTRYKDSSERSAYYYPVPESLSGTVDGDFHSPSGGPNLKYQIKNAKDYFEHGDSQYILDGVPVDSGSPNSLNFSGQNFTNVAPGETFKLGVLNYHNGNSYYDSHATGVRLKINLELPNRGQSVAFDLVLDLVNTENDPDDPAASADYVRITNLQQNLGLLINGVSYRIQLGFGATDSFGFSTNSQFHVYEGATGTGELLGTFIRN